MAKKPTKDLDHEAISKILGSTYQKVGRPRFGPVGSAGTPFVAGEKGSNLFRRRMDGFLVVGRSNLDDTPLGLFETRSEAVGFAKAVTMKACCQETERIMKTKGSMLVAVGVVAFIDGKPDPFEKVKEF